MFATLRESPNIENFKKLLAFEVILGTPRPIPIPTHRVKAVLFKHLQIKEKEMENIFHFPLYLFGFFYLG